MKLFYAGDSPVGGPANYLLGVLRSLGAQVTHLPPTAVCRPQLLDRAYDAVILSDFPKRRMSDGAERAIARHVADGRGLLMVGGWASFSGPFGGWRGSRIERLLPVACAAHDDRVTVPGGAVIVRRMAHPILRGIPVASPPVICGLNAVRPKTNGRVVLSARAIVAKTAAGSRSYRLSLGARQYPLLVVDADPRRRAAAFTTDVAPHWCGGFVDWGRRTVQLRVTRDVQIEVGQMYVRFLSNLIRWVAGRGG